MELRKERVKDDGIGHAVAFPYIAGIYDCQRPYCPIGFYIYIVYIVGASEEKQDNQYPEYRRMGGP